MKALSSEPEWCFISKTFHSIKFCILHHHHYLLFHTFFSLVVNAYSKSSEKFSWSHQCSDEVNKDTNTELDDNLAVRWGSVRYGTSSCIFLPLLEKWWCFWQSCKLFNLVIADVPISVLDRVDIKIKKINYSVRPLAGFSKAGTY